MESAEDSLIIQPLPGIGDLVWHLPHIQAIAKEEGPVTLLTKSRSLAREILKHDPAIKQVLWLERNPGKHDGISGFIRLLAELKKGRFTRAWALHPSPRYAWLCRLLKIKDIRHLAKIIAPNHIPKHPIDRSNLLLRHHGITPLKEPLIFTDQKISSSLIQRYTHFTSPWIGIGIGTSEPNKQWGAHRFSELIAAILKKYPTATFFIVGGKKEEPICSQILRYHRLHEKSLVAFIDKPFQEVIHLLKHINLLISNDTGVLNVACALETPVIGLFGVTPPLSYSRYIHPIVPQKEGGMKALLLDAILRKTDELLSSSPC